MNKSMALEWLKAAKLDLDSIECIKDVENLSPVASFHAQQAVEKLLKALLELKQMKIPKVHKLQTLIARLDIDFEVDDSIIMILDDLYIDSRYPGDLGLLPNGKPTLADVKQYYEFAKEIFNKVKSIIAN